MLEINCCKELSSCCVQPLSWTVRNRKPMWVFLQQPDIYSCFQSSSWWNCAAMHHSSQRENLSERLLSVQLWYASERKPLQFANGSLFTCFSSQWFVCFHLHWGARQSRNWSQLQGAAGNLFRCARDLSFPAHTFMTCQFFPHCYNGIPKKLNPRFLPFPVGHRKD